VLAPSAVVVDGAVDEAVAAGERAQVLAVGAGLSDGASRRSVASGARAKLGVSSNAT